MTNEQLAAIRARCEAATIGPWIVTGNNVQPRIVTLEDFEGFRWGIIGTSGICKANDKKFVNAEFIAHAREDVPALLAEVAVLRELMADRESDLQFEYDRANQAEAEIERLRGLLSSGAAA